MGENDKVEVEAKLVVLGDDPQAIFDALRSREEFAGLRAGPFAEYEIHDCYFDFEDAALEREGSALRLRERAESGERQQLLALKGPGSQLEGHRIERLELEANWSLDHLAELSARFPRPLKIEAREMQESLGTLDAQQALHASGLHLIQERNTKRWASELSADGGSVAELALDLVRFGLPETEQASVNGAIEHFEIEVEAKPGADLHSIDAVVQALLDEWAVELIPWRLSKTALGRCVEQLAAASELAPLCRGDRLTPAGYESVARLGSARLHL